jgi:hypothetical protein
MNRNNIETLKKDLQYLMDSYSEGNSELHDIIRCANKISAFQANIGIDVKRIEHNPREKAFHDQWLQDNYPSAGIDFGHGILQNLFFEPTTGWLQQAKCLEEINKRDRMIVATVIQWLGSNCGMAFLSESFKRFGGSINYSEAL